jgi:hypothetical protein
MTMSALMIANIALGWGLLVLIWLVQIIVYPGFRHIPPEGFRDYHRWYTLRIGAVVTPLMLGEAMAAAAWLWTRPQAFPAYLSAAAVVVVWGSTFGLQVPIHRRLQHGKNDALIQRLVATNWIRTAAWSLKAAVVMLAAV